MYPTTEALAASAEGKNVSIPQVMKRVVAVELAEHIEKARDVILQNECAIARFNIDDLLRTVSFLEEQSPEYFLDASPHSMLFEHFGIAMKKSLRFSPEATVLQSMSRRLPSADITEPGMETVVRIATDELSRHPRLKRESEDTDWIVASIAGNVITEAIGQELTVPPLFLQEHVHIDQLQKRISSAAYMLLERLKVLQKIRDTDRRRHP